MFAQARKAEHDTLMRPHKTTIPRVSITPDLRRGEVHSDYARVRLGISILIGSIGAVSFWSGLVVMPVV